MARDSLTSPDSLRAAVALIDSALARDGQPGRWATEGDTLAAYLAMRAGWAHWRLRDGEGALRSYGRAWTAGVLPDSLQIEGVRHVALVLTDRHLPSFNPADRQGAINLLYEALALARTTGDGTLIACIHESIADLVRNREVASVSRVAPAPPVKRRGLFVLLFLAAIGGLGTLAVLARIRVRTLSRNPPFGHDLNPR